MDQLMCKLRVLVSPDLKKYLVIVLCFLFFLWCPNSQMKVIFPLSKFHYIHKPLNGFHYRTLEIYVTLFVTNMPLVPIIFDRNEVRQARLAQILMTYYPILSTAEPQHSARKGPKYFWSPQFCHCVIRKHSGVWQTSSGESLLFLIIW